MKPHKSKLPSPPKLPKLGEWLKLQRRNVVFQCKHPGCYKAFPKRHELDEHAEKDYHCEECGFGNSDRLPQGLKAKMKYCGACEFDRLPISKEDENGST